MTAKRTFTIEVVDDREGLMTAEPAPLEPTVYDAEDFDGTFAQECGTFHAGRTVTLTIGPGDWNPDEPVEVEGYWGTNDDGHPAPVVEHIRLPPHTDDEIGFHVAQPFAFPPGVRVVFPTQPVPRTAPSGVDDFENLDADGPTFTLGVGDVHAPHGFAFDDVRANSDGRVAVQFDEEHDDALDMVKGERLGVPVVAVRAEGTTAEVTLFVPAIVTPQEQARSARAAREVQEAIELDEVRASRSERP